MGCAASTGTTISTSDTIHTQTVPLAVAAPRSLAADGGVTIAAETTLPHSTNANNKYAITPVACYTGTDATPTNHDSAASNLAAATTHHIPHEASPPTHQIPSNDRITVTAHSLVSGGLLVLSMACQSSPLPGSAAVAAVLKLLYATFNAATTKQIWLAEFMVRLRTADSMLLLPSFIVLTLCFVSCG